MQCDRCREEAVVFQPYSGRHLCGRHFIPDLEARAKRTIRRNHWLAPGDRIGVPGDDSCRSRALVHFLDDLVKNRRDISLVPEHCSEDAESGSGEGARTGELPTRIATPASLDEKALDILTAFLQGDTDALVSEPAKPGTLPEIHPFISIPESEILLYARLKGLCTGTEGTDMGDISGGRTFRGDAECLLDRYTKNHPSAKFSLLHLADEIGE